MYIHVRYDGHKHIRQIRQSSAYMLDTTVMYIYVRYDSHIYIYIYIRYDSHIHICQIRQSYAHMSDTTVICTYVVLVRYDSHMRMRIVTVGVPRRPILPALPTALTTPSLLAHRLV